MGQLLAFFRRPTLDAQRVRRVWLERIDSHEKYFQQVITKLCSRNEAIRTTMLCSASQQHAASKDEQDFVLTSLADRIVIFFHHLIAEDVITNINEAKRACYDIGRQHSAYGSQPLKIAYWEEFTLTMMETLEEGYPQVEKDELKAWHTFMHFINENMIDGYHDALPSASKR